MATQLHAFSHGFLHLQLPTAVLFLAQRAKYIFLVLQLDIRNWLQARLQARLLFALAYCLESLHSSEAHAPHAAVQRRLTLPRSAAHAQCCWTLCKTPGQACFYIPELPCQDLQATAVPQRRAFCLQGDYMPRLVSASQ